MELSVNERRFSFNYVNKWCYKSSIISFDCRETWLSFQVDLEPQGKIHVIVELKWQGKFDKLNGKFNWEWLKIDFPSIRRSKQYTRCCQINYQSSWRSRIQRASRIQSSSWCYAKTCSSGQIAFTLNIEWLMSNFLIL